MTRPQDHAMTAKRYGQRPTAYPQRQIEGEEVLRLLLLAFALAMPMASMAYLKIQHTRLSYAMSEIRNLIRQEEEVRRTLLLERSHFQGDEEIQAYADKAGMLPRKQSHLIPRTATRENQRLTNPASERFFSGRGPDCQAWAAPQFPGPPEGVINGRQSGIWIQLEPGGPEPGRRSRSLVLNWR